jgi:hypothetical protein
MDEDASIRRRLSAILAADIAGYSRLMGQDEAATVRDLKGHQAVSYRWWVVTAAASSTRPAMASSRSFPA